MQSISEKKIFVWKRCPGNLAHAFERGVLLVCSSTWKKGDPAPLERSDLTPNGTPLLRPCLTCLGFVLHGRKSPRGFASLPAQERSRLGARGGKKAHARGRAHQFTREEARRAGHKGGVEAARRKSERKKRPS